MVLASTVCSSLSPSNGLLALHKLHRSYASFAEFQPDLPGLLQQGRQLHDCISLNRALGILEPLTGEHMPPEAVQIQGENFRESLISNGLLSRNRAVLWVLARLYGSLETLKQKHVYLTESFTGFAIWLRRQLGSDRLICSEFLEAVDVGFDNIRHEDLRELTLLSSSFDLVICSELFDRVRNLDQSLAEIVRVLRPGGRLVATCPMAFGQSGSLVKALYDPNTGKTRSVGESEWHHDPLRSEHGSLVYRIPGWELLDQLRRAGMAQAEIHHLASWKYGILGTDLPGILVIVAQK